ncbi:rRNA N(6)-adenosine-methyltransferase ZCCHC4 isoform X2 [Lycorma delicatula]|uniref:rRNA N(6)-adenosine-methyltransferase ZCCHC4 isoform X2 n=1 Tax=Lycorma delicatula TaxID=130591 RepID=UPI003F510DBA
MLREVWLIGYKSVVFMMEKEQLYCKLNVICENLEKNPRCPHGPTLLYERIRANGTVQMFFACSAYRSRKDCSFFLLHGSTYTEKKKTIWDKKKAILLPEKKKTSKFYSKRLEKIKKLFAEERSYCLTCDSFLLSNEHSLHKSHNISKNLSDFLLNHPSQFLYLKTNSKGESQFIFSNNTLDVIISALKELHVTKFLCLGTPSIHEKIREDNGISSLLLDIDHRYNQFYDDTEFCLFNMMNFHFFGNSKSLEKVKEFLSFPDVVLIMDPPFSARSEPLVYTLSKLNSIFQSANKNINLPGSKTSVVRIFTNLDASKFVFPIEEGYHFCHDCNRWVSRFNKHCFKCGICPSKNGQPYNHCDICFRCVKSYWFHCHKCGRCALQKHPCDIWKISSNEQNNKRKSIEKMQAHPSKKINKNKVCNLNISK